MKDLTAEDQLRLELYRTIFLALHHFDPDIDESKGTFMAVIRLAQMLGSANPSVRTRAEKVLEFLTEARLVTV